jgi:hypothetical protein
MRTILLTLCAMLLAPSVQAATYYVAKTGSDSTSCASAQSSSTPRLTINGGVSCLGAGDTLIVKAGTYSEAVGSIPSGTSGNPTTLRSEVRYGATIKPPASGGGTQCAICLSGVSYVTIDGFRFDGTGLWIRHIADFSPVDHITIQNNEIFGGVEANVPSNSVGIAIIAQNSNNITVRGNKIHDIGERPVSGQNFYSYCIYWRASNSLIEKNELANCSGYAIHNYSPDYPSHDNIFRQNYIHNNGTFGTPAFLFSDGGDNNTMYDNIIANNGGLGIHVNCCGTQSTNSSIYNNTIYGNGSSCIQMGGYAAWNATPLNTVIRNNICYSNGADSIVLAKESGTVQDHNLLGINPQFANAAGGDFHLTASSTAVIAQGVPVASVPMDFADTPRVLGQPYDLGAYVYGSAPARPPVPTALRMLAITP